LNVLGIRIVMQAQMVFVAIIIAGMLAFIVPGALNVDLSNYTPLYPPDSFGPFIVAMISLSIALQGFNLITDLGEELKNPVRNIPRVLFFGAVISITLMVGVVVVAVGVVPWEYYVKPEAGVAVAAGEFLPWWGSALVALAAVVGAFTTINTLYTSYSRQIMRAARDHTIPFYLSKVHPRFQTPYRSILLVGVPALFLVPLKPSPVTVSTAVAMAALFGSTVSSVALWNLPKRFPDRYKYSLYRLPLPLLKFLAVVTFVV
ncbi:MAG: amino acid permease, partial [Halobacteria archaeon]|nr:amino acid permease [Halobacteria archaeon]